MRPTLQAAGRLRLVRAAAIQDRPSRMVFWRRRVAALLILVFVGLSATVAVQAALGRIGGGPLATTGVPSGPRPAAAESWVVRPGDTLWSIATALDPRGDPRPIVDRLAGEVGNSALYPGEVIALPASLTR